MYAFVYMLKNRGSRVNPFSHANIVFASVLLLATPVNHQCNGNDGSTAEETVAKVMKARSYFASAVPHLITKVVPFFRNAQACPQRHELFSSGVRAPRPQQRSKLLEGDRDNTSLKPESLLKN
jgi:hypothetical protein